MSAHYTYLNFIPDPQGNWQKLVMAGLLAMGLVYLGRRAKAALSSPEGVSSSVVPSEKITAFSFLDFFVEAFVKFHDSVVGKHNRKHVPFTGTLFLFILSANLIGLIPGVPAITTTVWVTVAMALVVFIYFNTLGIKENGLFGYLKHFCGPVIFLAPVFFPLEIFSTCLRILTLNLRLYWNISADHLVVETFTNQFGLIFPLYLLGTFVCFMQAFVFTMLTMVYILLATQHEEEHH